jgi:heme oxygenase|nr:biliverdin-producing heme oxygenase [Kofleriaceae bacterium]
MSAVLAHLREATRAAHEALDANVRVDPATYPAFLRASLAAVEPVERAIAAVIPFAVERTPALRADLDDLGAGPAASPAAAFALDSPSAAWGAAYVVEGSTLGGLVLADRAGPAAPTRYLRLRGKDTAARWKAFLRDLDAQPLDVAACCRAASATFDHYARAFRDAGALP